jgi:holin-like protein
MRYLRIAAQIAALAAIFHLGSFAVERLHLPVPGNVLGMLMLFGLLCTGVVREGWIADGAGLLTRHLSFFFIPIVVGLIDWAGLLVEAGPRLLVALVNPVFIGSGIVIAALLASGKGLPEYRACQQAVTALLGPAPVARGLAVGTMSHAIGTAAMLEEGETQGAMSGVAFSLNAVLTALIAPLLIPWLITVGAQPRTLTTPERTPS